MSEDKSIYGKVNYLNARTNNVSAVESLFRRIIQDTKDIDEINKIGDVVLNLLYTIANKSEVIIIDKKEFHKDIRRLMENDNYQEMHDGIMEFNEKYFVINRK